MRISFKIGQSVVFWAYIVQILMGVIWIAGNLRGDFFEILLMIFHLVLAYIAGFFFLQECMNRFFRSTNLNHIRFLCHFGAISFMTIPQCMQTHLSITWDSVCGSLFLIVIATYLKLHEMKYLDSENEKIKIYLRCQLFIGWAVIALFRPFYAALCFPFALSELVRMWKAGTGSDFAEENRRKRVTYSIVLFVELIVLALFYKVTPASIESGLAKAAVSRFSYTHFEEDYDILPTDIHDAVGLTNARKVGYKADGVEQVLLPIITTKYNETQAVDALWRIAEVGWKNHPAENLKQIVWDMLGYQFPAFVVPLQLKGRAYEALTGHNYELFTRFTPIIGRICIQLNTPLFLLFLFGGVGGIIYALAIGQKGIHLQKLFGILLVLAEALVIFYSLSGAGQMDYMKTCPATLFWYTPGILMMALRSPAVTKEEKKK